MTLKRLSETQYIKEIYYKKNGDHEKDKSERQKAEKLFDRAFRENEALIEHKPDDNPAAYKRQGVNLYLIGDFEEAVAAHEAALTIDETYLADRIDRGYASLALANKRAAKDFDRAAKDFDSAVQDFDAALHLPRDQADTMIWLYLSWEHARTIRGDKADPEKKHRDKLQSFKSKVLNSNHQDWHVPIIELFLDSVHQSPDAVLESAKDKGAPKCKRYFYVAEWYALYKSREEATKRLEQVKEFCQFYDVELQAAEAELKRLGPPEEGAAMGASPGISRVPRRSGR